MWGNQVSLMLLFLLHYPFAFWILGVGVAVAAYSHHITGSPFGMLPWVLRRFRPTFEHILLKLWIVTTSASRHFRAQHSQWSGSHAGRQGQAGPSMQPTEAVTSGSPLVANAHYFFLFLHWKRMGGLQWKKSVEYQARGTPSPQFSPPHFLTLCPMKKTKVDMSPRKVCCSQH